MSCSSYAMYGEERFDFPPSYHDIASGSVTFTKVGRALAKCFDRQYVPGFFAERCIPFWEKNIANGNDILGFSDFGLELGKCCLQCSGCVLVFRLKVPRTVRAASSGDKPG